MKLSEYLKKNGMTQKEYFDMQKRRESGKTTLTDYRRNQKSSLESQIGFDTFESDLNTVGKTVSDIYNGWQSPETMKNTRSTIEAMNGRINAFQEYQKLFGGDKAIDITDLAKGYNSVLEDWDSLMETYGYYQNADAFNVARKNTELEKKFRHEDGKGYTFEEVQNELKKYSPDSDEYKYLSTYTNYSDLNDFDKAVEYINANTKPAEYPEWYANAKSNYDNWEIPKAGALNEEATKKRGVITYYTLSDQKNAEQAREEYFKEFSGGKTLSEFESEFKASQKNSHLDELNRKRNIHALDNKVDLYKPEYEGKEDFAENSKYVTTYDENKKGYFNLGYGDLTYEYINDVDGAREKIKNEDAAMNRDGNGYVNQWERKGYHLLRDDEVAIYNYKYQVEGKKSAEKFLKEMQTVLDKRRTGELSAAWKENYIPVVSDAATVIVRPAANIASTIDNAINLVKGEGDNPYSYAHTLSNYATDTRKNTSEYIAEKTEGMELFGQNVPSFLYNTVMSMADSAYGNMTFKQANSVLLGMGAFQEKAREMVEAGENPDVVWKTATTSGVAEMLFESIGIDNLFKIKNVDSLGTWVKSTLKQGGVEMFEEIGTEITNIIADDVFRGENSELYKYYRDLRARGFSEKEATTKTALKAGGQVAWAGVGGFLSGSVMGGVTGASNYHNNKVSGAEIRGNERVGDMMNIASMTPQESDTYKAYTEYAKRGINESNVTDAQLGNLRSMAETDAIETLNSKDGLFKKGATAEQKADAETTYNRLSKMNTENKAAKVVKELPQNEVEENGESALTEREIAIDTFANGMKKESEAKANLFRMVDDGKSNAGDYADSFNLVVSLAQNDFSQDYILENRGVLSTAQVNSIYQSVVTNPKMAQQKRINTLVKEMGSNIEIKGTVDDSVIDYDNTGAEGKVNWNSLHPNVKSTIAYVSGFAANVAGMDVQLVTNGRDYGFTGMYDRRGNTMLIDITARTEKSYADSKGRRDNTRFVMTTVAHELTHWMEEKAPELYAQYDKMVMDALTSGKLNEADVIARRQELLQIAENKRAKKEKRDARKVTEGEARREVIARASEEMLALSEEGKKYFDSLTESEQKQFGDKIRELFQTIKDWIKNVLSKVKSDSPEAQDLRALAQDLDAISKKWDEMLRESAKVNAAMKKAGINDNALVESKVESEIQYANIDSWVARYTPKQYNDYGWVAVNKVLTGKELKKLYSQFARIKLNKEKNIKNKLGEYLIPVGDKYGGFDHLVYIKGTNEHPIIRHIVEINEAFREHSEKIVMEVMRDESTGLYYDAFEIYGAYAGEGIFTVHKPIDYPSYSELKNEGRRGQDGRRTYSNDRERNDGTRVSGTRRGEVRSEDVDEVSYSDIDDDTQTAINQTMTMAQAKDMIQRAFVLNDIKAWYDDQYKDGDEWLAGEGAKEVAMYIENTYEVYGKYIGSKYQGIVDGDWFVEDIVDAYVNKTLTGKVKEKTQWMDLSQDVAVADKRFYSPKEIKNAKKKLEVAKQRITNSNRATVTKARAEILLYAHNKGAAETLGLTESELKKMLRQWGGYSASAREISMRFNNNVANSNRWVGIENCSWLKSAQVSEKELARLVNSIEGDSRGFERNYIARTMLALDTHIDWSEIKFVFTGVVDPNRRSVRGLYDNRTRTVTASYGSQNTVAHEMGHALDYKWARDLGFNGNAFLTDQYLIASQIKTEEQKLWYSHFKDFVSSITDKADLTSEYTMRDQEVFARFVASFVEWVDKTATGRVSYGYTGFKDRFTGSDYVSFVKILQEKAMLDSKAMATEKDVQYSDIDSEDYAPTFYSHMGKTIDEIKQDKIGASSVIPYLKGKGVKNDEIKWSGIETFLEGKKSVTKEELQEFANGSMLKIEEKRSDSNDIKLVHNTDTGEFHLYVHGKLEDTFIKNENGEFESLTTDMLFTDERDFLDAVREENGEGVRWKNYKLEGGENYREIVFTMPNSAYTNNAMMAHWGDDAKGVLAHARIQDFNVDGKKMLFVEEIQSDWHNAGKKYGYEGENESSSDSAKDYKTTETMLRLLRSNGFLVGDDTSIGEEIAALNVYARALRTLDWTVERTNYGGDPEEPLVFVLWDDGDAVIVEENAEDFKVALDNELSHIRGNELGEYANVEIAPDAPFRDNYHEYVLKRLIRMAAEEGYDSIGWTTADIQSERWSDQYAEGYRIEYDQDIPKFLRKYGKTWGATVGKTTVETGKTDSYGNARFDGGNYSEEVWSMDITDSMKNSVLYEGQVMYSDIDVDSDGEKLTMAQQRYFKDSKVRDKKGRLLRVYHGTKRGGFTVFSISDEIGYFFTRHLRTSKTYADDSKTVFNPYDESGSFSGSGNYEVFLNIRNPFVIDGKGANWNSLEATGDIAGVRVVSKRWKDGEGIATIEVKRGKKTFKKTVTTADEFEGFLREYFGDMSKYLAMGMDGVVDENGKGKMEVTFPWDFDSMQRGDAKTTREIAKRSFNQGYDGVIFKNVKDSADGRKIKADDLYVAFDSNQIKSTANKNPTTNDDIRYSDIDEDTWNDLNSQLREKENQIRNASMELRKFDSKSATEKLYAVTRKKDVTEEELDNALKEYADWEKESGYGDAFKKHYTLKDEAGKLYGELREVEGRLLKKLKEQFSHFSEEDVKKYVSKAVRKYHTTSRLENASYLLTTGSMLDFSDGHGYRVKDHREISEILDLPDYAGYSDGMIAFMNMGNIRLQTYGIDVSAMPNAKQISALRDIIFKIMREYDEFSVDFSKPDGYSAGSVTYGKGTSTSKIVADIKSFFETGVVPEEQSGIRDFLYSDIDDDVDVYEVLGENKRLQKENKKLQEDFERLVERLKLERQVTGGTTFNRNQLDAVAGHIRNIANSDYSKKELVEQLNDVYTYIITTEELAWENDLYPRFLGIAKNVLEESRLKKVEENDYFKTVLKDIRSQKISLSDVQKQELESVYGTSWNKVVIGKLNVSNDATMDLDSQWKVWSETYPGLFDAETTEGDQIIKLLEMYDDLKDGSEVYADLNNEDMIRWLADEIYNQYWNVSTIKTTADKYEKQIKMLNWEHRKAMKELRDAHNERLEKQKLADDIYYKGIISKIRSQKDEEIKRVRKLGKERMDKYKEEAARKTRIQSITSNTLTLNEWLNKNSKDKHIHDSLKGPVINLIQAIDFSSKQLLGMKGSRTDKRGTPTQKDISLNNALGKVQKMMADANVGKEELVELYGHSLDEDIVKMMDSVDAIMRTVGDNEFILNQMTLEDLTTLDNIVNTIKGAVTKMNKFHAVHHARGIENLSQETIIDADELGKANVYNPERLTGKIKKLLNWRNVVPYYAFKRYGKSGQKIFEAFQDGWDKLAFNVKEIIDHTQKTYKAKEVREWEEELHTFKLRMPATEEEMESPGFKPQYQDVQMTTAQIMHLYLLDKRAAAKSHLLGGGIRVADIETKNGKIISQTEGILFEQSEIDAIIKTLTPRQIEVANALSKFMNTTSSDWGNEVSMARFGYKAFGEENYVPIQADKNNLAVDDETEQGNSLFKLLNMSFTKSLIDNANNRIIVSSLFDVFAQHTSDMAKYNALALPVLDAFRWFNYKEKGQKGDQAFITKSVKTSLENAFGKDGLSYITTFLKDINGQDNVTRDTVGSGFFKNAKIAAVAANLRVALLQPTAYLKASATIDNKYLVKALFHKPKIARAIERCGMALWKSMGYFDTNIQRGVAEQIKHAETFKDKAIEVSMKGAEWGDKITFGYLWNACELEIREKRKDLKPGTDEFFKEVGLRLREVIYTTQVVDSTITRSEMMRSGDGRDKMLTAFASEPTLAYNMLQDAYIEMNLEARRLKKAGEKHSKKKAFAKYSKRMARVFTAYTVTNIVAAMVESGFDVLRDDEEEEMDLAEFMKLYLQNFADNQMILTKIPYAKEMVSIMQGFTSSRTDTQWMASFSNTLKQLIKLNQGEGNPVKLIKNLLQTISYFTGLPFYNAYRDALATLDKLEILTTEDLEELLEGFID